LKFENVFSHVENSIHTNILISIIHKTNPSSKDNGKELMQRKWQ